MDFIVNQYEEDAATHLINEALSYGHRVILTYI